MGFVFETVVNNVINHQPQLVWKRRISEPKQQYFLFTHAVLHPFAFPKNYYFCCLRVVLRIIWWESFENFAGPEHHDSPTPFICSKKKGVDLDANLVGGWTSPFKNICQNGNLPQIGVNIKNIWNHQPVIKVLRLYLFFPHRGCWLAPWKTFTLSCFCSAVVKGKTQSPQKGQQIHRVWQNNILNIR